MDNNTSVSPKTGQVNCLTAPLITIPQTFSCDLGEKDRDNNDNSLLHY